MGSNKKVPKTLIRSPHTWGLKAAGRLTDRINQTLRIYMYEQDGVGWAEIREVL
jgi:hypothetical protein